MVLDCLNMGRVESNQLSSPEQKEKIGNKKLLFATIIIVALAFVITIAGFTLMAAGQPIVSYMLFSVISFSAVFLCLLCQAYLKGKVMSQMKILQIKEKNLEHREQDLVIREKFLENREFIFSKSQEILDEAMQNSLKSRYPLYTLVELPEQEELEEFEYLEAVCNAHNI